MGGDEVLDAGCCLPDSYRRWMMPGQHMAIGGIPISRACALCCVIESMPVVALVRACVKREGNQKPG